jgi:SAM-dependent methyltransferase
MAREISLEMFRELAKYLYLHLWVLPRIHRNYGTLSVPETFQRIYRTKAWGDNGKPFSSGNGSSGLASEHYSASVLEFIRDHQVNSVIDLGCGDFSVGRQIVEASNVLYTGVDVVPELVEYHKSSVHHPRVTFQCSDITSDPLPLADLCLIRQVLQHLSNKEIAEVLANVSNFPWILVSEEVLTHPRSFNRDKPHGPDVRVHYGSGVYLDQNPFSRPVRELWNFPMKGGTVLKTVLLEGGNNKTTTCHQS